MPAEPCDRCGEVDEDRRTLWHACFYAMNELPVPFKEESIQDEKFFTLRVCKDCRADWMAAITDWFQTPPERKSCGSGIFVRRNGANVEITREEWDRTHPDREPVVYKGNE